MDAEQRPLDKLIADHLTCLRGLITRVEKKTRDEMVLAKLDRLRQRINILVRQFPDKLITEMTPQMLSFKDKILNRDETFFFSCDARKEYIARMKKDPPPEDEFVFDLVDSVRAYYKNSAKSEQDATYNEVVKLFNDCIEYKIRTAKK